MTDLAGGHSTATLYEASKLDCVCQAALRAAWPGARLAGPAFTVRGVGGDNLALHHAVLAAPPGSVLVADLQVAAHGHWGEILAVAAQLRGIVGLVIDGGVRDVDELARMQFPVFARTITVRGTSKDHLGDFNVPVHIGGIVVHPGDLIVGDADGVSPCPTMQSLRSLRARISVSVMSTGSLTRYVRAPPLPTCTTCAAATTHPHRAHDHESRPHFLDRRPRQRVTGCGGRRHQPGRGRTRRPYPVAHRRRRRARTSRHRQPPLRIGSWPAGAAPGDRRPTVRIAALPMGQPRRAYLDGAKHALYLALCAILDAGDRVIVTQPAWPGHRGVAAAAGGAVSCAVTSIQTGFLVTPEALEAAWRPRTKAVIIDEPIEPDGRRLLRRPLEGNHRVGATPWSVANH